MSPGHQFMNKYKHCPDCGDLLLHAPSKDGWAEDYNCDTCGLNIHISFGEPHHCEPDKETWTRKDKAELSS